MPAGEAVPPEGGGEGHLHLTDQVQEEEEAGQAVAQTKARYEGCLLRVIWLNVEDVVVQQSKNNFKGF